MTNPIIQYHTWLTNNPNATLDEQKSKLLELNELYNFKQVFVKYYKVKDIELEYKGERYYKVDGSKEHVLQICFNRGQMKKGRTNTVGMYNVQRMTFMSNDYEYYVEECTQEVFEEAFEKCIKLLKEQ